MGSLSGMDEFLRGDGWMSSITGTDELLRAGMIGWIAGWRTEDGQVAEVGFE